MVGLGPTIHDCLASPCLESSKRRRDARDKHGHDDGMKRTFTAMAAMNGARLQKLCPIVTLTMWIVDSCIVQN